MRKTKKAKEFIGISFSWDPKDKKDRLLATETIAEFIKKGYWYDISDKMLMSESSIKLRNGPPDAYMKKHRQLNLVDALMEVVDSEDLASIVDYLAHIGMCPMLYTVMWSQKSGKPPVRRFRFNIGNGEQPLIAVTHAHATQAAINAVLLWDKKGRP